MGTHLVAGRAFTDHDKQGSEPVAIVSETVARRYWPDSTAIGRHVSIVSRVYSGESARQSQLLQIVGVAKDVRNDDLWRPEPAIYVPFAQHPDSSAFFVIRTVTPPAGIVPQLRDAVRAIDPLQPVNRPQTMDEIVSETYGEIRFPMTLLWIFSALALVLAAVGIFGVTSYTVARRTRELAIRMSLGASRLDVLRLIIREGLGVTLFGIALGLAAALIFRRIMADYVFGVTATDPVTLCLASLLLAGVALLANYLPARRAAHVDPLVALRYE